MAGAPKCDTLDLVLPSKILNWPVTKVGYRAFSSKTFQSVTIPDDIIELGELAFSYNQLLVSVNLGGGVRVIGKNAFKQNYRLEEVSIPANVESLGSGAFAQSGLKVVILDNGLTSVGSYAFAYNQIESLTLPDSIEILGNGAFYNNKLTEVKLPNNALEIGAVAFGKNEISEIVIPKSVVRFGDEYGLPFRGNPMLSLSFRGPRPAMTNDDSEWILAQDAKIRYCTGQLGWPGEEIESITPIADCDMDDVPDNLDAYPSISVASFIDADSDGSPDICPQSCLDLGMQSDAFPGDSKESTDTDGDGIGNNADTDDDNDGYSDQHELQMDSDPLDPSDMPRSGGLSPALLRVISQGVTKDDGGG